VWGGTTYYDQYPDQERGASFPFSPAGATYFLRRSSVHAITYAPPTEPQAPVSPPVVGASLMSQLQLAYEDFYDWQSYLPLRSVDGFRNHLFRSVRNCGPV